jgi:hypothetical protein
VGYTKNTNPESSTDGELLPSLESTFAIIGPDCSDKDRLRSGIETQPDSLLWRIVCRLVLALIQRSRYSLKKMVHFDVYLVLQDPMLAGILAKRRSQ